MQISCSAPINDVSACGYVVNLTPLTKQDISSPAPCITFKNFELRETGDPDFTIAEDGTKMDVIAPVKAQEEKGIIRIQYNKGGDFAFLLSLYFWNQLKVYHLRYYEG
ncbi:MAG: hypothetical protein ACSLEN_09720 [Candidatus Malihini olakiniferum]